MALDCLSSDARSDILMMVLGCGRMEEIIGSIAAEVDVPTSRRVLASLDVIGTVGTAKLHVPKSKPVICRCCAGLWFSS